MMHNAPKPSHPNPNPTQASRREMRTGETRFSSPSAGDALAGVSFDVLHQVAAGYLAFWKRVHRGKCYFHHALDVLAGRRW